MRAIGLAVLSLASSVLAFADAPLPPPSRLEEPSSNRQYVAVADPQRDAVIVYRVEGSQRTELWSVAPWQRSFYVADDGEHLVVCPGGLNLIPRDAKKDDAMLRFYEHGTLKR